jgi:hypothetical protein
LRHDFCHAQRHDNKRYFAGELRGPDADLWRTLAAWLWMTYLFLVTGAVLWWLL